MIHIQKPPFNLQEDIQSLFQILFPLIRIVSDHIAVEWNLKLLADTRRLEIEVAIVNSIEYVLIDALAARFQSQTTIKQTCVFQRLQNTLNIAARINISIKRKTNLLLIKRRKFVEPFQVHPEDLIFKANSREIELLFGLNQLCDKILWRSPP